MTDLAATKVAPLDLSDRALATEVHALQRAAYAVEAELIGFDGIPPLHESLDDMLAAGETWLGIRDADGVAGAVSYEKDGDGWTICRLIVAPRAFRRGHGRTLVAAALAAIGDHPVAVSTGSANVPALALYRSMGFTETRRSEVAPGVTKTELAR